MSDCSIATVISYCTNDFRFIGRCIEEASKFSKQIVVSACDHFFDGSPESRFLLNRTYARHPGCLFVEFPYLPDRLYSQYHSLSPDDPDWSIYWAATSRYIGYHYLDHGVDWVLFLDSDEILEGDAFLRWLEQGGHLGFEVQRMAAYLYAIRPSWRCERLASLSFLVKKDVFAPLTLWNGLERMGAYLVHPGSKRDRVLGLGGRPLVHHYTWVRTREECLRKARTWGHRKERDWPDLIEQAISGDPSRLFEGEGAWGEIACPYFDPFADLEISAEAEMDRAALASFRSAATRLIRVSERDLRQKEMEQII